jgi:hypothetical protein
MHTCTVDLIVKKHDVHCISSVQNLDEKYKGGFPFVCDNYCTSSYKNTGLQNSGSKPLKNVIGR